MSSTDWLGAPDVSVMSEDGHRVMTHRAVLGLYSSSFRHLLSINSTETCKIILHDADHKQKVLKLPQWRGFVPTNLALMLLLLTIL